MLGTRDYVRKSGFRGAVIGLSGGIDSALTTAIAADALGADAVTTFFMPSQYTSAQSYDDAKRLADNLGVRMLTRPHQGSVRLLPCPRSPPSSRGAPPT